MSTWAAIGVTTPARKKAVLLSPLSPICAAAAPRVAVNKYPRTAPATIVTPFPVEQRYVSECGGKKFNNYIEWLGIAYAITLVCCPALSLPCGFTSLGLPVGLQMVAPPRGEARLLAGAKVLEDILGLRDTTPIDPRGLA